MQSIISLNGYDKFLVILIVSMFLWKQERGFLPLSAALLSSSVLRSEVGPAMDVFVDIASSIEAIIFSLLFCRSGFVSVHAIFINLTYNFFVSNCVFLFFRLNISAKSS